jgi:hypothetical protein
MNQKTKKIIKNIIVLILFIPLAIVVYMTITNQVNGFIMFGAAAVFVLLLYPLEIIFEDYAHDMWFPKKKKK